MTDSDDELPSGSDDSPEEASSSPWDSPIAKPDDSDGQNDDSESRTVPLVGSESDGPSMIRPYDADLSSSATGGESPQWTGNADSNDGYTLKNPPPAWQHDGPDWTRVEKVDTSRPTPPKRRRKKSHGVLGVMGCNLIVFLASVCVMVLELTASRLIAKHVGSSLYTWTSVIGVVLAGITVGNFLGGLMADRFDREKTLARLFLLASAASLSVLWLDRLATGRTRPDDVDWPMWVFLTVAEMFFLPALALGTISPVVASIALDRSRQTGFTVGNVYAWGAFGSIVGTFLTGFWLIDLFGSRMIIGGTAAALAILGVTVAANQILFRTAVCLGWFQFLLFTTAAAAATSEATGDLGEAIGRWNARENTNIASFADWYDDESDAYLSKDIRDALLMQSRDDSLGSLDKEAVTRLRTWWRSGYREKLDAQLRADIEQLIDSALVDSETVNNWRRRGEDLGYHLHELGLCLYLRSDRTGEYHDESNYSYINVSDTYEDEEIVRQLRLDKLVHSYFNPEKPTKLYYEYEEIYAELTERVATKWSRRTSVPLEPFDGLDELTTDLPPWAEYDTDSGKLSIRGVMTPDRRHQLIKAAPYGDFWLAIEELAGLTRDPLWGGLSSVRMEALPPGSGNDRFLADRLTFEPAFKTLNCFRVLTEDDVQQLCSSGDAAKTIAWRTAVDALVNESRQVSTFFIGGGGFVFPRWIESQFSDRSRIDVAELDPAVKLAVQKEMGLPPDDETAVNTLIGDARNVIDDRLRENAALQDAGRKPNLYDFVYGDAFNDFSVPWHLTTLEFNQKVKDLLNPEAGVYMINVIDAWPHTMFVEREQGDPDAEFTGGFTEGIPEVLQLQPGLVLNWQFAPAPYGGLEVLAHREGRYEFAVRGIMPESLRDRLLEDAGSGDAQGFKAAVEATFRRSREKRSGRFLASCTATLGEVFPHVYVFSTAHGTPAEVRDTYVIVASVKPIELQRLASTGRYWDTPPFASLHTDESGQRTTIGQMECLLATSRGLILTDDFAPVDNLLRPVFDDQD